MYRLLGENHLLGDLPFSAQVFLRALDGVRNRLAAESNLTNTELRALSRVAESSGLDCSTLGSFLEHDLNATTDIVYTLLNKGLMTASSVELEGSTSLRLSAEGHALIATTYEEFQRAINEAAESLDADRLAGFQSGMLKMARKLEAQPAQQS